MSSPSSPSPSAPFSSVPLSTFRSDCGSLVRRLLDATTSTMAEMNTLNGLLQYVVDHYAHNDDRCKLFVKEFMANALSAAMGRSISQTAEQTNAINEAVRRVMDIVNIHVRGAVPIGGGGDGAAALPPLSAIPPHLLSPIQPPIFLPLPHLPPNFFQPTQHHSQMGMSRHHVGNTENPMLAVTVEGPLPLGQSATVEGPPQKSVQPIEIANALEVMKAEMMGESGGDRVKDGADAETLKEEVVQEAAATVAAQVSPTKGHEEAPAHISTESASTTPTATPVTATVTTSTAIPPQNNAAYLQSDPVEPTPILPPSPFLNLCRNFIPSTPQCPSWLRDLDVAILDCFELTIDPMRPFYQHYGLEKPDASNNDDLEDSEELRAYRATISPYDWIDVFHNGKWKIGQVVDMREVQSMNGPVSEFRIHYENLDETHDEWLPSTSVRLAKLRTKSLASVEKWRLDLEVNSVCDALDTVNKWYTARVVEAKPEMVKVTYDGWSNRYDEWMVRTSNRLAAYRTKATGGRESNGVTGNTSTRELDDSQDTDEVAIFRGREWGSFFLTENLKYFGGIGGFDLLVLRIIWRQYAPIAVPLMRKIVDAMGKSWALFSKPFLMRFMPVMRMAYTETLLELSDVEMRAFGKDDLEEIVKGLEKLLRRFMTTRDCAAFLDKFQLDCALKRFRSSIVQRRVQGMTTLQDILGTIRRFNYPHWWSPPVMIYFIRTNQILEDSFGLNGHPELMRRSMEMMKFFAMEQKLSKDHLRLIWNSMEQAMKAKDEPQLQLLYKGLDDLSSALDSSHVDFLFDLVRQVPYGEFQVATLDLVKELTKWSRSGPQSAKKAIDLLWEILQDDSNATNEIAGAARVRLEEIVKSRSSKPEYMERCIAAIKESRSVPQVLSLLRAWIDSYFPQPQMADIPSRLRIIEDLTKAGMLEAIFSDIAVFKQKSKTIISKTFGDDESKWSPHSSEIDGIIIGGNSSYLQSIRSRFDFLHYLIRNSFLQITREHIELLWKSFFLHGFTNGEKEEMFSWLTKTIALKIGYTNQTPLFPEHVDEFIFHDLLIQNLDYTNVSLPYFKAFESMFLLVNCARGAIQVNRTDNDTSPSRDMDFQVLKFEFVGFEAVWRVALEAVRTDVVTKSIGFLNRLHEALHESLKVHITDIRSTYIDSCMKHFKEYSAQHDRRRLLRCLSLLHRMLDASETKGVGTLRSHGTRTRGKVLNLTIINSVKKSEKPPKFTLKCHSNDTLFELREQIASDLGIPIGNVKLWANGHVIAWDQNVKNLADLKIRDGTPILVRRTQSEVQQSVLLDSSRQMVPALRVALLEIFEKFAHTNGTMSKPDFAHFIIGSGSDESCASDDRVNKIFREYTDLASNCEVMTAEQFLEFYRVASNDRSDAVWADLKAHGYRKDLRREIDVLNEEKRQRDDEKMLPRYLLASNGEYFNLLFESLVEESQSHATTPSSPSSSSTSSEIASVVWDLLQRLPTNPDLYHHLFSLDSVNNPNPDWNSLLDSKSVYKLLYALQILESLTEPIDDDEDKVKKLEERDQWSRKFLVSGGFKHLYDILTNAQQFKSQIAAPSLDPLRKKCLSLLLKMIYSYVISALTAQRPNVPFVSRIRSESVDVLSPSELAEQEKQIEKEKEREQEEASSLERSQMERMDRMRRERLKEKEKEERERAKTNDEEKSPSESPSHDNSTSDHIADISQSLVDSPPDLRPSLLLLGRQMSLNFSNAVLSNIDFGRFLRDVWNTMLESATNSPLLPVDVDLCEPALNCIANILLFDPQQMLPLFYNEIVKPIDGASRSSISVFMHILTCPSSPEIRKFFATALSELSTKFEICTPNLLSVAAKDWPCNFLLKLIIASIPTSNPTCDLQCEEFFLLFRQLLHSMVTKLAAKSNLSPPAVDSVGLFNKLSAQVSSIDSFEPSNGQKVDKLMCGTLNVLDDVVKYFPAVKSLPTCRSFVEAIFSSLLFADNPKCKAKYTRQLALNVIIALAEVTPPSTSTTSGSSSSTSPSLTFKLLFDLLTLQHSRITKLATWDYNPEKVQINSVGYVGLRNLASTCYMNSLLQQFFMIPRFRYGIVTSEDREEDKSESLLYQFQTMFSFLAASEKQSYDTQRFVHTYKDENGNPTNPRIQQDAQEFFNVLCDRLEKKLKGTNYAGLIKSLFGGKIVNQVICHGGCTKPRETDEDFYCLSLQVESLSSMEDSLNSYVLGEQLGDFNCDACGRKTEITKRSVIGKLPHTLILHLKRFKLNYETWQHDKLNNRFSFPSEINFEPFSREGFYRKEMEARKAKGENVAVPEMYSVHPREYYQYKLFGILVHLGTAQQGHYFSFIKERCHRNPGEVDSGEGRWLEFNDNQVRPFDPKTIPEHCFGGDSEIIEKSAGWSDITLEKQQNAYMLVYERASPPHRLSVEKAPQSSQPTDSSQVTLSNIASLVQAAEAKTNQPLDMVDESDESGGIPPDYWTHPVKDVIPPRILDMVKQDNLQFFNDRQIFNVDYFKFMSEVVRISPSALKQLGGDGESDSQFGQFLQLVTSFAIETLIRSSENKVFTEYVEHLQKLIEGNHAACCWILDYLASKPAALGEVVLAARDQHVRKGVVDLAFFAITQLAEVERGIYYEKEEVTVSPSPSSSISASSSNDIPKTFQPRSAIVRYLNAHLSQIGDAPKHWMRFNEYFTLLESMAKFGHEERQLLQSLGVLTQLGDLFLVENSPLWDKKKRRLQMGNVNLQPNWTTVLSTISILIRSSQTQSNPLEGSVQTVIDPTKPLLSLNDNDVKIILQPQLYAQALSSGNCVEGVVLMILHWCIGNEHFSSCVVDIILFGLQHAELSAARPYFDLITALINLKDAQQNVRFEKLLAPNKGILHLLSQSRVHGHKFTYLGIKLLVDLIASSPEFAQCMMTRRSDWVWMDQWLKDYINRRTHYNSTYLSMNSTTKNPSMERQESRAETFDKYSQEVQKLGGQMQISETVSAAAAAEADEMAGIRVSGNGGRRGHDDAIVRLNRQFVGPYSPEHYQLMQDEDFMTPGGYTRSRGAHHTSPTNRSAMVNTAAGPSSPARQNSDGDTEAGDSHMDEDIDGDDGDNEEVSPGRQSHQHGAETHAMNVSGTAVEMSSVDDEHGRDSSVVRAMDVEDVSAGAVVPITAVVDHQRNAMLSAAQDRGRYAPGGPQWECPRCTLLNDSHIWICNVCEESRPT